MYRVPPGVPTLIQRNFIWWIWPSWLRRQIVALKIVGSSPIIHPIKQRHPIGMPLFYGMDIGLERRKRKHASGMFSRRGRVLRPARRSPVDCELSGGFCLIRLPLGCLHFMEWIRDSKSPTRCQPGEQQSGGLFFSP